MAVSSSRFSTSGELRLFNLSYLLEQMINGITLGGLYALIALGYTMVYGILLLINFGHS